jgi:hypothetical protein
MMNMKTHLAAIVRHTRASLVLPLLFCAVSGASSVFGATFRTSSPVVAVAVGDMNNDGRDDIVSAGYTSVDVLLGNGDGTFQAPQHANLSEEPALLALADFNRDGKLDVAVTITNADGGFTNTVAILLGNGDGTLQRHRDYVAASYPYSISVADFNADGTSDLVVGGENTFAVLLGNGDGTFQPKIVTPSSEYTRYVAAGDLNEDGKADVVVSDSYANVVTRYLGNGDGTFQAGVQIRIGFALNVIKLIDMNGDSHLDLVAEANYENRMTVLLGAGNGTLGAPIVTTLQMVPVRFTAGDFNGDGNLDLALSAVPRQLYGKDSLVILLGKGDGTFQPAIRSVFIGGAFYAPIAAGEFNGDSALDVVGQPSDTFQPQVKVVYGVGDGTFVP